MYPLADIQAQFPLLERTFSGKQIAYLDNAATSQKPSAVIEAIDSYYRKYNANIHRGVYTLAEEATELYEGARRKVAHWINAEEEETIFVRNATEAINLVAYSWGRNNIGQGDKILITEMEHHSNIVPWQLLAQERDAELHYTAITDQGLLDLEDFDRKLALEPKLVALTHISNVLGTINPVDDLVGRAQMAGAKILIDGAQAAPHLKLDMESIAADFYVFTGHKMYGPTGIGVLYGKQELLEEMPPFLSGGDMIKSVDWQSSSWNTLPWKFEAGTSAVAEGAGLGAAVEWLEKTGVEAIRAHEKELTKYALGRLGEVSKLEILGPEETADRSAVISFEIDGIHPHDVAQILNRDAVCVRAGHHCAQPLMRKLGVAATSRASFGAYNSLEEIDRLIDAVENAKRVFEI